MEPEAMRNRVFNPTLQRLLERKDSLVEIGKIERSGFQGWLKVEVITALANKGQPVKALTNRSPHILLEWDFGLDVEAMTDLNIRLILDREVYCLFLGDGSDDKRATLLSNRRVVCHEVFSDGVNCWVLGLLKPP